MTRQIRDYHERTGYVVGFKPAGGIRKANRALDWLILMKEELGIAGSGPICSDSARRRCSPISSASSSTS